MYAAFYKDDWRKLTPSVFLDRVDKVRSIAAFIGGYYSTDDERRDDLDRRNREILIKRRFPTFFPEEQNV